MFEECTRLKLRFKTDIGLVTVEDLWSFTLERLNDLAKSIHRELKRTEEESFIEDISDKDKLVLLRFDIVKHIIKVKLDAKKASADKLTSDARKAKILEVLASKQDSKLDDMSEEDLLKELDKL